MSQQPINHSEDLKKLKSEGFEVEIKDNFLLIHSVPYVDSNTEVKLGVIVSELNLLENKTTQPSNHVVHWIGEHPCHKDGRIISQIQLASSNQDIGSGILVNHSFSNKPQNGYKDYYEKMTRYIEIISNEAQAINSSVTPKTFAPVIYSDNDSIFNYSDTNSIRSEINIISDKFKSQKIAIIGLGGTGSYVLDLISKTTVQEIHLFDDDVFLQHNAFRSPSAASVDELNKKSKKTDYFKSLFSPMRQGIISHPYNITDANITELANMDFVFICIDTGQIKEILIDFLQENDINFIDTGIGVTRVENQLIGQVRTTLGTKDSINSVKKHISFDEEEQNEYSNNIQIAELNMLNATMAVIQWKKLHGFYQELKSEYFHSVYSTNNNVLVKGKCDS